jgi:hypothetical protein
VKREVGKGEKNEMSAIRVGLKKNNKQETIYSTFLTGCFLPYCTCLINCLVYIYVSLRSLCTLLLVGLCVG